jgi:hypothetical protein
MLKEYSDRAFVQACSADTLMPQSTPILDQPWGSQDLQSWPPIASDLSTRCTGQPLRHRGGGSQPAPTES